MADRTHIGLNERLFFLTSMAAYFLLLSFQEFEIGYEWMRYYAKDLLFVPLLLTAIKISMNLLGTSVVMDTKKVVIAVIYAAVVFEFIVPLSRGMVFEVDLVDILAYAMGGILWSLFFLRGEQSASDVNEA